MSDGNFFAELKHLRRAVAILAAAIACSGAEPDAAVETSERWTQLRGVFNADFNSDGSRVIARLRDQQIGIWDVEQGDRIAGDVGLEARSIRYEMSGDHRLVLVGFENGSRVFDSTTAAAVSPMLDARLRDQLRAAAVFSPNNENVVIFEDKQTSVWDARTGARIAAIPAATSPHEDAPPSAIFTDNGAHCFLMDADGTVMRYETRSWKPDGKPMRHPRFDTAYEFGVGASRDGKWIGTVDDAGENGPKGQLQIWDATTSKPVGPPLVGVNGFSVRFLTDPARVVVQPARGEATVRALPSMKRLYTIKPPQDEIDVPRLDITRDGKWILAWSSDRTLLALDSSTGKTKGTYPQKATIRSVLVEPNSETCFVSYDNSTFLSEGFNDNYIMRLRMPDLNVTGKFRSLEYLSDAALSPNGRRLLVREGGDDDERLLIFNASDMSRLGTSDEE